MPPAQVVGWGEKSSSANDERSFVARLATHHFVVNLVEMYLADFVDHILALKCDEAKTWNRKIWPTDKEKYL